MRFHVTVLLFFLHASCLSQEQSEKARARARKLYDDLVTRPVEWKGFRQFYDAWSEIDSLESLENFLRSEAGKSPGARTILVFFHAWEGQFEKAESVLRTELTSATNAVPPDRLRAVREQHVAVLLELGRSTAAAEALAALAADGSPGEAVECAVTLAQTGHVRDAAAFLRRAATRFPENYRLAWIAARLTEDAGDRAAALTEYLRLATATFGEMAAESIAPDVPGEYPPRYPLLTPVTVRHFDERPPVPGPEGIQAAMLRAMLTSNHSGHRISPDGSSQSVPRVPGPVWQLRGWAAGRALRLAQEQGAAGVISAQQVLLEAGLRPAILAKFIAGGPGPGPFHGRDSLPDLSAWPDDQGWLLRFFTGQPPALDSLRNYHPDKPPYEALVEAKRPPALRAWRYFRNVDDPYAVYAALLLLDSPVAEERAAAQEAIALLERVDTPPVVHLAALPALTAVAYRPARHDGSAEARLLALLPRCYAAAPQGPERDWLRHLLLLQRAAGDGPAAFLALLAEEVNAGTPNDPPEHGWSEFHSRMEGRMFRSIATPGAISPKFFPIQHSVPYINTPHLQYSNPDPPPVPRAPEPGLPLPGPGTALLELPLQPRWAHTGNNLSPFSGPLARAAWRLLPDPWSRDAARLRAAVEECPHAGIKALASLLLKDEVLTTRCMEVLAAEPQPVPEHLVIVAAWEWRRQQPGPALALLDRAGALPLPDVRGDADSVILGAVNLLLWAQQPLPENAPSLARAALERMVTHPLPERGGLAVLARALGHEALAAAHLRGSVLKHSAPPPDAQRPQEGSALSIMVTALSRGAQNRNERPAPDPALVVQGLLADSRRSLFPNATPQYPQRYPAWSDLLPSSMLDAAIRKRLHAAVILELERRATESDISARLHAGLALLMFQQVEKGAAHLEQIITSLPEAAPWRRNIALALAWQAPEAARRVAADLPAADRAEMNMRYVGAKQDPRLENLPETLAAGEMWLASLREIKPSERGGSYLEENALRELGAVRHNLVDDVVLPAFPGEKITHSDGSPAPPDASLTALAERRRVLLLSLYRELLRLDVHARVAYQGMIAAASAGVFTWESRRADTLLMLRREGDFPDGILHPRHSQPAEARQVALEEALTDTAWLRDTVLPALREARKPRLAVAFTRLLPLLECTPQEFPAAMERFLNAAPESERYYFLRQAVALAERRGVTFAAGDIAARAMRESASDAAGYFVWPAVRQLYALGGQPALDAWVQKITGPPLPPDIWNRPSNPGALWSKEMGVLARLAQTFPQSTGQCVETLRLRRALEQPFFALPKNIPAALHRFQFPHQGQAAPADGIAMLEAAGFLADLPDFRLTVFTGRRDGKSPAPVPVSPAAEWLQAYALRTSGPADSPRELLALLEKDHAGTFGGLLAAALLGERIPPAPNTQPSPRQPLVLALLGRELPRLRALPAERQADFAGLQMLVPPGADASARSAQAWLDDLRRLPGPR